VQGCSGKDVIRVGDARGQALRLPAHRHNHAFRYLLVCEAIESNAEKPAFTAHEHPFRELSCAGHPFSRRRSVRFPNGLSACPIGFSLVAAGSVSALNALNPGIPNRTVALKTVAKEAPDTQISNLLHFRNIPNSHNGEGIIEVATTHFWVCLISRY
jgi:hypothetical protein